VVVGDVEVAAVRRLLEQQLGGWSNKVAVVKPPAAPVAGKPTLGIVDRPGAPQSVVVLGRLGPSVADPNQPANELVNLAIGGSFASRLNSELREKKGYTYGISSSFVRAEWAGTWRVGSSIRTDATGPALRDILTILDGARTPMPAAELAKAKALAIRSLPQDFETNAGIAGAYLTVAMERRPLTYYRDLPGQLAAVTAEGAAAAAESWRDLSIVVVGDWAAIGKDLESLGLPIVRLDADGWPRK
jgi:zinc protease